MSKPDAPQPPDYGAAASAQGQANVQGAVANKVLGNTNQITPFGNLTFDQTGTTHIGPTAGSGAPAMSRADAIQAIDEKTAALPDFMRDNMRQQLYAQIDKQIAATGGNAGFDIPQFTATTTLSPALQKIFDQFTANKASMGGVAAGLLGQAGDTLQTPFDPSKLPADSTQQAVQDAMYARQSQYLDPQFALAQKALDARLANSGFQIGNEGYDKAQSQFGDTRQKAYADARDSAIQMGATTGLSQRQQAVAEALAARNQPINELSALMTGSQVQQPQFMPSSAQPTAGAPTFDAAQAQQNALLQNYGIQSSAYNSQIGGLMGLGSAGIMAAALSDRRAKKNIRPIGQHPLGLTIYAFDYLNGSPSVGLMADEVERIRPDAVFENAHGLKMVDYGVLAKPTSRTIE